MKVDMFSCQNCGGPLPVQQNQFIAKCPFCNNIYYVDQGGFPGVSIKAGVSLSDAKSVVLSSLRDKEFSPALLKSSYFESGDLLYIPFYEVRGIKGGYKGGDGGQGMEYSVQAYEYVEPANNMESISIDYIDPDIVSGTLVNAEPLSFDPVEMRKKGIVLPASVEFKAKGSDALTLEEYVRVVYLPVWEIKYSFNNIVFKAYVSAVDGTALFVQGLRNQKAKLLKAMAGMFSGTLLMGIFLRDTVWSLVEKDIFDFTSFFWFLITLGAFTFLFPFLWEQFAFKEEAVKTPQGMFFSPINYEDAFLVKVSRGVADKFADALEKIEVEVPDASC